MRCGRVISFTKSQVRGGSGFLKKKKKKTLYCHICIYTLSNNQIIPSIDSNTRPSTLVQTRPDAVLRTWKVKLISGRAFHPAHQWV